MMTDNKGFNKLSMLLIHVVLMIFALLCIIPLIAIISISLTDEASIVTHGYRIVPKNFSMLAYRYILRNPAQILRSYYISAVVTFLGGLFSLLICSLIAYPLSRSDFKYKNKITFYVFFTMLFNGGLVPWYIMITRYLQLTDTLLVLILPYLVVPWFVLLLRTFFQKIPISVIESTKIDGASEWIVFFKIILPLSKPALATIGLFIVLQYWNDWWLSLLFIRSEGLIPLQYMLYRIMASIQFLTKQMQETPMNVDVRSIPSETARMAMVIIAAGPVLFIFPFFQKYFVKGLTVGAIKE